MAEVSVQLHSCLNAMKKMSREGRDNIIHAQQEIFELKKDYEALGNTITEKEETLVNDTKELETLNVSIKETQQQYKKILDSTHELMRQVKEYNPSKADKAENIIEQTLDDLKASHQEIQMTNYTIAKSKHESDTKLNSQSITLDIDDDNENNITHNEKSNRKNKKFSNRLKNMKKENQDNMHNVTFESTDDEKILMGD